MVTKVKPLRNLADFMEQNARLMEEVVADPALSADEKLRSFSIGIRNQCSLNRDLAARRAELLRYQQAGLHCERDNLQDLAFTPQLPALPATAGQPPEPASAAPDLAQGEAPAAPEPASRDAKVVVPVRYPPGIPPNGGRYG